MSLQDDYYDLKHSLSQKSNKGELHALERIWFAFCDLEAQQMVDRGELSKPQYNQWYDDRTKDLKARKILY